MTARAGMHFPCCNDRKDVAPSPRLDKVEEAVMRQFIRFGIPPEPRECATRRITYLRQLTDLAERHALPQGAVGALRDGEFKAEGRRLKAEATAAISKLRADPYSYRYWRPTEKDWRKLAIRQAMWAHDSRFNEPELLYPLPKRGRGRPSSGKFWTYAHFVRMARRKLAHEQGVPTADVEKAAAADEAIKLMKIAAADGDITGPVPLASTIKVAWQKLGIDDPENSPAFPPQMQFILDEEAHLERIETAANFLGIQRDMAVAYPEFARWADIQIWLEQNRSSEEKPWFEHRPPHYVCCWKTHGMWIRSVPSPVGDRYKQLLSEFYALPS